MKQQRPASSLVRWYLSRLLPPFVVDIQKKFTRKPKTIYYGLNELDRKLERWLGYENGYFVELGANDGVKQSNTLYFEKQKNWKGVLIEPTPQNYLLCIANRSDKNHFFCNACVSFGFKEKFVEIMYSNLMSTPLGLESDVLDPVAHATQGKQFMRRNERIFSFGALASPLNNLLAEANAPSSIDLLSLDVEGAELEVLKGINHSAYRFKYICVESRDLTKIRQYLVSKGYELVEKLSHHDYLFKDSGLPRNRGLSR